MVTELLELKAFCDEITLFVCIQIIAYTTFEYLQFVAQATVKAPLGGYIPYAIGIT